MDITNLRIDDIEIMFVNETQGTRNGFKHVSHCFINGVEKGDNTSYYFNRTWECYKYQTCMLGLISKLIENRTEKLKEIFKDENDYKILNSKRKAEFEAWSSDDKWLNIYKKIYNKL